MGVVDVSAVARERGEDNTMAQSDITNTNGFEKLEIGDCHVGVVEEDGQVV